MMKKKAFDDNWITAKSVPEAIRLVQDRGLPVFMSLDHDLGGDETSMQFLHWLANKYYNEGPPEYQIHSANPVGRMNIGSFLRSWKKSLA